MDQQSLDKLNQLHPKLRDIAIKAYNNAVLATPDGVHPVIDQTYRSFAESDKLYQQGRTTPGEIVSNAKAGQSWHNYALALDFHLIENGKDVWPDNPPQDHNWMIVVNIFKAAGFNWGGDFAGNFHDYPHLEYKFGQTLNGLLASYEDGHFIPGTQYVNF
jgi:peptidoglycan L-alanyl-D-glutamate endopeptidase CwlK